MTASMSAAELAASLAEMAERQDTEREIVRLEVEPRGDLVDVVFACSATLTGAASAGHTYGLRIHPERAAAFYLLGPGESLAEMVWLAEIRVPQQTPSADPQIDRRYSLEDGIHWRTIPPETSSDLDA